MPVEENLKAALADANTVYKEAFNAIVGYDSMPGRYPLWCEVIPNTTRTLTLKWLANHPVWRRWHGEKRLKALRAFSKNIPFEKWEVTMGVDREDLAYDSIGLVARNLEMFVRDSVAVAYDQAVFDLLKTNPVAYDNVGLFATNHPFGPGGASQSNWTQAAFTRGQLVTGVQAMKGLRMSNGQSKRVSPTHIAYATNMEQVVLDSIADTRLQSVNQSGALDASSNVSGAAAIKNNLGAGLTPVHEPELPDGAVVLLDNSKGARPIIMQEQRKPEPQHLDQMNDSPRFWRDKFIFGAEGDFNPDAGFWEVAHLIAPSNIFD